MIWNMETPQDDFKTTARFRNQLYNVHELALTKEHSKTPEDFGFTLISYCPCHVDSVSPNSNAYEAGVRQDDLIIKINNVNCCRASLRSLLHIIKQSGGTIVLTVYRPTSSARGVAKSLGKSFKPSKKKNKKFFSKFLCPSMWLPCKSGGVLDMSNVNELTLPNQTYYKKIDMIPTLSPTTNENNNNNNNNKKSASQLTSSSSLQNGADTGYETSSETTDRKKLGSINEELTDETRTKLIENLLDIEASFVSYLSMAVATLARPLRGFLMKQQDYFVLFQNIEKILIISENFLRSMNKWSSLDLYTRIGQLYTQKLSLFREAFTIYAKGHAKSKCLLHDLKLHSKQFRMFLKETQSDNLTLGNLIDLPLVYLQETLDCFKRIKHVSSVKENKANVVEAAHIDSVINELYKILYMSAVEEGLGEDSLNSADNKKPISAHHPKSEHFFIYKEFSMSTKIDFDSKQLTWVFWMPFIYY